MVTKTQQRVGGFAELETAGREQAEFQFDLTGTNAKLEYDRLSITLPIQTLSTSTVGECAEMLGVPYDAVYSMVIRFRMAEALAAKLIK